MARRRWRQALYGPSGFFTAPGERPGSHFRTSAHASPLFARGDAATGRRRVDEALGRPDRAGRGRRRRRTRRAAAPRSPALAADVPGRRGCGSARSSWPPARPTCPRRSSWSDRLPPPGTVTGLLLATEWLDNVPLDIAEVDADGRLRYVLVDPVTGDESPAGALGAERRRVGRAVVADAEAGGTGRAGRAARRGLGGGGRRARPRLSP